MKNLFLILFFTASAVGSNAQHCLHQQLSKHFSFRVDLVRTAENDSSACNITIAIISKLSGKTLQKIHVHSDYIFSGDYTDCNSDRSYVTGRNRNAEPADNNYGDIIVADFNFDGKEDLAVKGDSGGNGGPLYNFYIQQPGGNFIPDHYLTRTMEFFPAAINNKKKTLTTLVHANAYQRCKTTYKQDTQNGKWHVVGKRFVE